MLSLPQSGVLRIVLWALALVALLYSVVPITYGIFGAPLEFLATGLILLVIGLALITRLAPGRPMLWLGVLLLVYGFPFLFTTLPLGLPLVLVGSYACYRSTRKKKAPVSGNFDFSRKPGATKYFILTTVTLTDHFIEEELLQLRRDLHGEASTYRRSSMPPQISRQPATRYSAS